MVTVDPEFRGLIPPLTAEELEQLEANIVRDGCRDPMVVWNDVLLDGHNRFDICQRHNLPFTTRTIELPDRDAAKFWVIRNQLGRRNLTPFQRAELALKLEPLIAEKAKEKQRAGGQKKVVQKSAQPVKTRIEVARAAGISHDTLAKAKVVVEKAPEAVKQALRNGETTINKAYQAVRSQQRRNQKLQELRQQAAGNPSSGADWQILTGDCVEQLDKLPAGTARMVFADPPYNIGIDYGEDHDDRLPDETYLEWVEAWMRACHRVLTDDGSLWVMICDEYAGQFAALLKKLGFTVRNWVKWYETFGTNCPNKFNRTSRHIFYTVKDPDRFIFNADAVCRASDRQTKYADARANPAGKTWDDVWQIPRLVGTSKERLPDFPTQLPLALLEPIVLCSTNPNDLVIDPFSGSGTTGVAAIRHGRRYLGFERSERFVELSRLRLQGAQR